MKQEEMKKIACLIDQAILNKDNDAELGKIKEQVESLTKDFPIYQDL